MAASVPARGLTCGEDDAANLPFSTVWSRRSGRVRAARYLSSARVGKTALLRYAVESGSDLRVAHALGVECEMELPFAARHLLCAPMLDQLDRLPAPQRGALGVVFALAAGPAPDAACAA